MWKFNIRKANPNDLPAITDLAGKMVDFHRSLDNYYKPLSAYKNLEKELAGELADKNSLFLVIEKDNKIIGYFRGSIEPAPAYASPKKIGVIYDIYVQKEYRKQGVGEALMKEILEWFQSKNIKNIELSVDARNNNAINFWKKFGFFEYKLRLRKDL
jgi:ribosomal protein S18 acetylase RimI-like enzyme